MKIKPLLLTFAASAGIASADDFEWNNPGPNDWNTPSNWTNISIGAGNNDRFVNNGGIATVTSDGVLPIRDLKVGVGGGTTGTVNHSAGTLSTGGGNWAFVGSDGGTGTYNLSGGTLNTNGGQVRVGNAGGTGTLTATGAGTISTHRVYIGSGAGSTGTLTFNSTGAINAGNDYFVGEGAGSNGTLNLEAGTLNMNDGWAFVGGSGSTGKIKQTGGTVNFSNTGGNRLYIGTDGGTGTYEISGGTLNSSSLKIGDNEGLGGGLGTGTMKVSGTAVVNANDHMQVGRHGSIGHLDISGGQVNVNSGWFGVANDNAASAGSTVTVSAGQLNLNGGVGAEVGADTAGVLNVSGTGEVNSTGSGNVYLGFRVNGHGTLNISGGQVSTNALVFGQNGGAHGILNGTGGTLFANTVGVGGGTGELNFDGVTIKAKSAQAELLPGVNAGNSEIKGGGVTIDTNSMDVSTSATLDGQGGLTKTGAGNLTLNGITTYTGQTIISAGTLTIGAGGAISPSSQVTVATGASLDASPAGGITIPANQQLDGTGTVMGNVAVVGTLAPGNSIGTLNITGNLSLTGTSDFEISPASASDLANVTGSVTYGGILNVINTGGALTMGDTFNLFDGTSFSGTFSTINYPASSAAGDFWINNLSVDGTLTYIPEPSASLMLIAFGSLLIGRRRRNA